MAVLAMLVGALEILNALGAAAAAGGRGRTVTGVVTIGVVIIVAALLFASGVALLVRRQRAIGFARVAAFGCLLVFAAIAVFYPVLSIVSTVLGMAFPIAMLLFTLRGTTPVSAQTGG